MNRFNKLIQKRYNLYCKQNGCRTALGGVIFRKIRSFRLHIMSSCIRWYYHCDIPYSVDVSGCYFNHKGFGVVINPLVKIGRNVDIQHSVTIGENTRGVPIIGNNVVIGAKATIIGDIHIGDNVIIGAGAVVVKDVPNNCTVAGVPARKIN